MVMIDCASSSLFSWHLPKVRHAILASWCISKMRYQNHLHVWLKACTHWYYSILLILYLYKEKEGNKENSKNWHGDKKDVIFSVYSKTIVRRVSIIYVWCQPPFNVSFAFGDYETLKIWIMCFVFLLLFLDQNHKAWKNPPNPTHLWNLTNLISQIIRNDKDYKREGEG